LIPAACQQLAMNRFRHKHVVNEQAEQVKSIEHSQGN
jgi:hypothetical protein